MAFISQGNDTNGCALAAIASVVDSSYEDIRLKLRQHGFRAEQGLYILDMIYCLRYLGKKVPRSTFIPKRQRNQFWIDNFLAKQKSSCILCCDNEDARRTFHAVIWDTKHKLFWDPGYRGMHSFYDYSYVWRIITIKK